ncbi:GDSL esterase/lipase [Smittium culicis]|uniref:GDSL esterase/lipase n=1 Tax=Smittium culicis TaxID=133412 RepID=A0A1R1YGG1_9FUNG|nr:GDSL esterase/lipase [Smittium culicis]
MIVGALAIFTFASASFAANPHLVSFGDSFSDIGNVGTEGQDIAYWNDRHSNGPLWNEYLAFNNKYTLVDFANAGSTVNNTLVNSFSKSNIKLPSLSDQIDNYVKLFGSNLTRHDVKKDIAAITVGSNDFSYAMKEMDKSAFKSVWYSSALVDSIVSNIEKLINFGFKKVILFNIPDLKNVPGISVQAGNFTSGLDLFVTLTNLKIEQSVKAINDKNIKNFDWVRVVNYYDVLNVMANQKDPKRNFGIINFNLPCNQVLSENKLSKCTNPNQYFFFDSTHPTTKVHALIGAYASELISNSKFAVTFNSLFDIYNNYKIFEITDSVNPLFIANSTTTGNLTIDEFTVAQVISNKTQIINEKRGKRFNNSASSKNKSFFTASSLMGASVMAAVAFATLL